MIFCGVKLLTQNPIRVKFVTNSMSVVQLAPPICKKKGGKKRRKRSKKGKERKKHVTQDL